MDAELDDFGDAITSLRRATHSATKVAADTLEVGTEPTDADLDRMICEVTKLTAATVAGAMRLKEHLRNDRWMTSKALCEAYGVSRKWVYNRKKRLGGVSRGPKALFFRLSKVVAELGPPPESAEVVGPRHGDSLDGSVEKK